LGNASTMHDGFVEDGAFECGEGGTFVQISRQDFATNGLLEDASERRTASFGELRSERFELGVRRCSLADCADDVGEVAAMERS
jgi:hypothetical protein